MENQKAPRVTKELLISLIVSAVYIQPEDTTLTVCVLTLKNGTHVVGESACVSPENFNADIGKTIAYDNAFDKIWPLEGYLLKERLYRSHDQRGGDKDQAESSDKPSLKHGELNHAIWILEQAKKTAETNEPINRAAGNIAQADSELSTSAECADAIEILRNA
jgi:hypothetical protein